MVYLNLRQSSSKFGCGSATWNCELTKYQKAPSGTEEARGREDFIY